MARLGRSILDVGTSRVAHGRPKFFGQLCVLDRPTSDGGGEGLDFPTILLRVESGPLISQAEKKALFPNLAHSSSTRVCYAQCVEGFSGCRATTGARDPSEIGSGRANEAGPAELRQKLAVWLSVGDVGFTRRGQLQRLHHGATRLQGVS